VRELRNNGTRTGIARMRGAHGSRPWVRKQPGLSSKACAMRSAWTQHDLGCAYLLDLARDYDGRTAVACRRKGPDISDAEMVGARGIEPPTPCTPCRCATRLRYAPTLSPKLYRLQPPAPRSWRISSMACRNWSGESAVGRRAAGPGMPPSPRSGAESNVSVSSRLRAPLMVNPCS
jgi:hypothetical protein